MEAYPDTKKPLDPTDWLDEHGDYLYRYAMFRLRDSSAAEDVLQETLLAALRARESYRGQGSERTWLVGILKHKIVDRFRVAGRWQSLDVKNEASFAQYDPFQSNGDWSSLDAPCEWPARAETLMENKEFWSMFRDGLAELPTRTATAFVLREVDGFSTEEICDALGISRENVWVMLHRARLSLQRFVQISWFATASGASQTPDSGSHRQMSMPLPPSTITNLNA